MIAKDFKPQIMVLIILWLLVVLGIGIDLAWPILTTPPGGGGGGVGNLPTTSAPTASSFQVAPAPLAGNNGNGNNNNNNNNDNGNSSRAPSPLGNGSSSSNTGGGNSQVVVQAPATSIFGGSGNGNISSGFATITNTNTGGVLYTFSRNIPPNAISYYLMGQLLVTLTALIATSGFVLIIKRRNKRQAAHIARSFKYGQTIGTNPPVDDNANGISWLAAMTNLFNAWYNYEVALPGNDPKARMRGDGGSTFFALELVSRRGDGIRHAVRLPLPTPTEDKEDKEEGNESVIANDVKSSSNTSMVDSSAADSGSPVLHQSRPAKKKASKEEARTKNNNSQAQDSQIPDGIVGEFTNLLLAQYRWCEVQPYQPGEDLLDLDKYADPQYTEARARILKSGGKQRGKRLVRGYILLSLELPGYYPIKLNFSGKGEATALGANGADPLTLIYKALDTESDSELLACGIEVVLGPPATYWETLASEALDKFGATEMRLGADARYTRPTAKGSKGGGLLDNMGGGGGGGGKTISPKQAARNRRAVGKYQSASKAIEAKLQQQAAFPVYIYGWAEGTERAVTKKLPQLASAYTAQFDAKTFVTKDGAADGNRFRIIKTSITPVEQAVEPGVMTTATFDESKFNSKEEAEAARKELRRKEQLEKKSKRKAPMDALAQVRTRAMPPYYKTEPGVLSGMEISQFWHLPSPKQVQNDQLVRAGAMSPAPERDLVHLSVLPGGEQILSDEQWRLVVGYYVMPDGTKRYVGITEQGILRGMYLPAKPGSGKSSDILMYALQGLTRNDRANVGKGGSDWPGNSVIIVDPNGDLTKDFLDVVPRGSEYEDRILLVDFTDPEWVVGLNLMGRRTNSNSNASIGGGDSSSSDGEGVGKGSNNTLPGNGNDGDDFNTELANDMVKALPLSESEKLHLLKSLQEWQTENRDSGGNGNAVGGEAGMVETISAAVLDIFIRNLGVNVDRTPNIFRIISNGVRLLIGADPYATLRNLVDLMLDPSYRAAVLKANTDPISSKYYEEEGEFEALFEKGGTAPAMGRLENLLRQESIRRVFCQRHQTLNIRQACDEGYVIIFYFPPKMAGDKAFAMAVTFTLITQAIFSRSSDTAKELRRTVQVFLDEFQEMVAADKGSLEQWLSQARKFGGAIVLAHQYLAQIRQYWEVIKGTVGTFMPMMLDRGDAKEFTEDFATDEWPAAQVLRSFDRLPPFSKIAKIFDNGKKHNAVLLKSLPLPSATSNEDTIPLLVAITDPSRLRGYRLEPFAAHPDTLQISKQKGRKGMWEPSSLGKGQGITPTTREYRRGLIEELASYLYATSQFCWRLVSPDQEEAGKMGLPAQDIAVINSDLHKLRQCNELLIKIEAMPNAARTAFLSDENKLTPHQWQVYLASRRGRNLVLNAFINANPGLIPNGRDRISVLSILKINVHISEVDGEMDRPNPFLVQAEQLRKNQRQQLKATNSEFYDSGDDDDATGKGKGKGKAITAATGKGKGKGKATTNKNTGGGAAANQKGRGNSKKGSQADDGFYSSSSSSDDDLDAYDED